ncbi:MAG: cytochrome c-550 [Synechococcales cyanobacterium RM1_1_8]|nr:cytochrome c-550 [Synechococcales cyanobacterium RM1_1_8]
MFGSESFFKRVFLLAATALFFVFQLAVGTATAAEFDADARTVKLNPAGDTTTLTVKQAVKGQKLFGSTCSQCHAKGVTKTDPNVGMDPEALANATPPRDSIESLVDYLKNPTSYDGEFEIAELHPSMKSTDIYPKMRNLSDEDLADISGYVLIAPKILGNRWGTGKTKF